MSNFRKRLSELFDKFKPGGEYHGQGVKDLSEEDKKVLSDLASQYKQTKMAGLSYEQVVQSYLDSADTIKREKVFHEHELDYLNETINLQDSMADTLKHQIATMASKELDEAQKEELKQKRAFYLELKKASKTNKQIQAGFEKSQAATESMLAATLGITKSYNFSKASISGGIKGFGKGIIKSFHPMNVISAVFKRVIEQFREMDKARATLFKSNGLSGFTDQLIDVGQDLRGAYGPQANAVAAEMAIEAQNTMKSFKEMRADGSITKILTVAGKFKKLGVSAGATLELNKYFNANMDYTADQQTGVMLQLHAQAKEMGRAPEEVFREMAESVPLYSRYGDQFPTIFRGISLAARKTNLSISDLQSLTEGLDTTEDAMKKAAKVNSLLGGNYLNGQELLAADPGDKVKLIARAYQRAEAATGGIHPRVLRSVYQEFGMDAASFKKMAGGEFGKFEKELADAPKPSTMAAIDKDIQQTLDAKDKIGNRLDKLVGALSQLLAKMPALRKAVNFVTDNIEYFVVAATGLSLFMSAGKMLIGSSPVTPKFVSGLGGPGSGMGGDGGVDGDGKKKKKKGKKGKAGKGSGYYNAKTNRFHDPGGKMISNKEAAGRGLDKNSTKKGSRKASRRRPKRRGRKGKAGLLGGCPGIEDAADLNMKKLKNFGSRAVARSRALVDTMKGRVASMLGGMQGTIAALKGSVSAMKDRLAAAKSRMSAMANKAKSVASRATDAFSSAKKSVGGFFNRVASSAQGLKNRAADAVTSARRSVTQKAINTKQAVTAAATRAGKAVADTAIRAKDATVRGAKFVATKSVQGAQFVGRKTVEGAQFVGKKAVAGAKAIKEKLSPKKALEGVLKRFNMGKISKFFGSAAKKIPIIGSLIEGIFAGSDIQQMIADGMRGDKLHKAIGVRIIEGLGGVIGGIGAAALVSTLSVTGIPAFLLSALAYTAGDWLGRKLFGFFADKAEFISKPLGRMVTSIFYPDLHKGTSPDTTVSKPNTSGTPAKPIVPVNDAQIAMTTAPMVKASFETSSSDDILLKKLHMLRKNLEDIHSRGNSVSLTVGNNKIATATAG